MSTFLRFLAAAWIVLTCSQCAAPSMTARRHTPRLVETAAETTWTAGDAKSLPWQRWPAPEKNLPSPLRGIVIAVHGLSGAASDFWPLGEKLAPAGLAVYGMQLRGQGLDPVKREHGDIRTSAEWLRDLEEFDALVRKRHPGVPIFWWGESLGSLICLHAATQATPLQPRPPLAGLILSSPPVELRQQLPGWKYALVKAAMLVFPAKKLTVAQLGGAQAGAMQITSGATHDQQMAKTAHHVEAFSLRLLGQIERLIQTAPQAGARVPVPLLVLYTQHDPLVSRSGVERWFAGLPLPAKTKLYFPQSYHLILHDTEGPLALTQALAWLSAHL
jgi:acylglycerol lipase